MNMTKYIQKIKATKDALDAIREGKSDHNLMMAVLLRLPEKYRGFVTVLNTNQTKPTFD